MEDTSSFPGAHGVIVKIDAGSYLPTKIKCGFQPHGIAADDSKNVLYVLSRNTLSKGPAPHHTSQCLGRNGFVNFIDLKTLFVLNKKYEMSVDPYFIYARP
jgi:DNA-binding beta-propeller fold protein YncE